MAETGTGGLLGMAEVKSQLHLVRGPHDNPEFPIGALDDKADLAAIDDSSNDAVPPLDALRYSHRTFMHSRGNIYSEKSSDFKLSQGDDMSKSTKLLIVEDDAGLRHVHDIFFNFKGFDLAIVPEGREVLQKVQTQGYDIVILDLGLPDIEGLDLLAQIRKVSAVPVIVMTARTDRQSINRSLELGANDYINKPFRPEILLKRIEAVLADPGSRMKQHLIGSI